jgi:phosphoenolpyruvate---glycerone phosphotransferase subunit DhaK
MMAAAKAMQRRRHFHIMNYAGDIMNFEMAAEMHSGPSGKIITNDDSALLDGRPCNAQGSRSVARMVIVQKIVGAAAERGMDLQTCIDIGNHINASTGSMTVALSSCIVPAARTLTFTLLDKAIEISVGIRGEAGQGRIDEIGR